MKPFCKILYILLFIGNNVYGQDTLKLKNIDAILYTGGNSRQPLVVGLGGSEGGNAWASRHWKNTRDSFIEKGYAFLAIGYFKTKNSPPLLEKIAIEDVYNAISTAKKNKKVNLGKIAIIGGSRGADLALLVASCYKDISCVIGLSASHAVFPGNTSHLSTSSWTYNNKELPFVPVNEDAVPYMMNGKLRGAFEAMLKDTVAEQLALIRVENIKGSILLISGTKDEICPSSEMCDRMVRRLRDKHFPYRFEHLKFEGGHGEPLKHFDKVYEFLETNMKN
ncbi:acyl-CoA thioester hydrolase/BAAT C-terminal domain-containing protein [Chitinophaga sp. S165]|uniref:acyl-CoA thioester hydrolase/BAAT C-terminal domain-containing protein n=1 Tax=Chitinophaga sp. S165 TaxID=2135462 RepID=UPI000D70ECAC|nr:acyl-CoA thioester hydrolase/BAAT C-terminal domain-containing protein [Chitinophaga sp. S165]PWV56883.1 bile acid acyltransferase/acyl-CoA thioester hydrolase-like protein [Chitinophaga sp. S165]